MPTIAVKTAKRFKVHCPHCDAAMIVHYEAFGSIAGCPACRQMMQVPIPVAQVADVEQEGIPAYLDESEEFYDI